MVEQSAATITAKRTQNLFSYGTTPQPQFLRHVFVHNSQTLGPFPRTANVNRSPLSLFSLYYSYFNFFICFLWRQLDNVKRRVQQMLEFWTCLAKPSRAKHGYIVCNANKLERNDRMPKNKNKSTTKFRRCFTLTMFVSQLLASLSTSTSRFCLYIQFGKRKTRNINAKHTIGDGSSLTRTYCVTAISFATWHAAMAECDGGSARKAMCNIFFFASEFSKSKQNIWCLNIHICTYLE